MINSDGSVWHGRLDVAQLDHAVIVQWRRAVAVSQHALRPAVHNYTL